MHPSHSFILDDYSRVDTIDRHIQSSCRLGSIDPEISVTYKKEQDVLIPRKTNRYLIWLPLKLLFKIAKARRNLDNYSLEYELKQEMDHLDLQLMNGDVQLLLMTLDDRTRIDYLHRLRQCCMLPS